VGIDDNATSTAITIDASENVSLSNNTKIVGPNQQTQRLSWWNGTSYELASIENKSNTSYNDSGGLVFRTAATSSGGLQQRLEINSAGNITVSTGNLVIGTSGKGIDFSAATPDGTGTVTSEVLDDYETGTWTPAWSAGTTDATYNIQVGTYTKIGNKVHAQCRVQITSAGTMSGNLSLTGLPFAASSTANNYSGIHCGYGSNLAITAGASMGGFMNLSNTSATMKIWSITTGATDFTAAMLSTNGNIMITAEYTV
jgi:hypothetical protein